MVRTRRAAKLEEDANANRSSTLQGSTGTTAASAIVSLNSPNNHLVSVNVQEASAGGIDAQALDQATGSETVNALPLIHRLDDDGELQYPANAPSPVPTEIVEEPRDEVPFERTISAGVVARDYVFHPSPLRPATHIFPILTTYIVFQYVRNLVRNLRPHRILLNRDDSVFIGLDLVYLIHFNWITIKDICWSDARDWLGLSLIGLYNNPRGPAEITYGAKRPSPKSPQVTKWFSRFANLRALKEITLSKIPPRQSLEYDAAELRRYGPFGEPIFSFFPYAERVVYWPLYEYLNGRGPKPMMSEIMERVFEPILNCHGGGIGGRGVPYERPRAVDDMGPLEGTEVEEVDIDPDLVTIGTTPVPVFTLWLMGGQGDMENGFGKQLKIVQTRAGGTKKGNGRPRKKTTDVTDVPQEVIEILNEEDNPTRRVTRSMARKANTPQQAEAAPNAKAPCRKNKGKQKARDLPTTIEAETGEKRCRDEDEDFDIEEVELVSSDPGASSRPVRRVRRNLGPTNEPEDPAANVQDDQNSGHDINVENTTERKRRQDEDDADVEELGRSNPGPSTRTTSRVRRRVEPLPTIHATMDQPSPTLKFSEGPSWEPRGRKRKRSLAPEPSDGAINALRKRPRLAMPPPNTEHTVLANGFSDMVRSPVIGTMTSEQTPASEIPVSSFTTVQNDAPSPVNANSGDTEEDEPSSVVVAAEPVAPEIAQQQPVQNPGPPQRPLRRTETTFFLGELIRPE